MITLEIKPGKYTEHTKLYPFDIMEVDTMFEIPYNLSLLNTLYTRKNRFRNQNPSTRFVIKSNRKDNYIKCWRTQ